MCCISKTVYLESPVYPEMYSEPYQISKMKHFVKKVNSWNHLTMFLKNAILGVSQRS